VAILLLAAMGGASPAQAQTITTSNLGANQVTLNLTADSTGTGYFTVLSGNGATCGDAAQTAAGKDSTGTVVRHGSLALTANTAGQYTVRNLWESRAYTVCFTPDGSTAPASLSFTTNSETAFTTPTWKAVGSADFTAGGTSMSSLAFSPDGTPYVAFVNTGNGNKATVMRFNGSAWETVGSPLSSGTSSYISLTFAPDGTPYVAFEDINDSYKARVMRWNGSAWEAVGSEASPGAIAYTSLAFAPDGTPYIAYADAGNLSKGTVMRFNGVSWEAVGAADFTASTTQWLGLTFSPEGTPYVAYADGSNSFRTVVVRFDGTSWVTVGNAGISAGNGYYNSLAFAEDGTLYLAFEDGGNSGRATVLRLNGGTWQAVGTAGISVGTSPYVKLLLAPDGMPYIAYRDAGLSNRVTVMRWNGSAWEAAGNASFSPGLVLYSTLAFSPDGTPYVAYSDQPSGNKLTVMKLTSAVTGPTAATGTATSLTSSSATLNGTVNDGGVDTAVTFDYGTTTSYGTNVAATTGGSIVAGTGNTAVAVSVASLQPGTTYHFRVNATANGTTVHGSDATFTTDKETPSVSSWPTASAITLGQSLAASVLSGGSASVPGTFDWTDKSSVPSSGGSWSEPATFTPTDTTTYNTVSSNVSVLVNLPTPATATISTSNLSASQVTLNLTSSVAGTGYFTVFASSSATCGTAIQTAAGQGSTGSPVVHGSLPLAAGTAGNYTVQNLKGSTAYTVCFTPDGLTPPSSSTFTTLGGKSLSSATWNAVGAIPHGDTGTDLPALTFAPDGTPYVAFVDYDNGQKATVMRFDGSSWQVIGSADFTPTKAGYVIPAFSPDGTLYVAYTNAGSTGNANVMRFNGTSWESVGSTNFTYGSDWPSLAFSPDGTMYLAYSDIGMSRKASVMKFDRGSSTWVQVGAQGFSAGQAGYTTLAFAPDGSPYVAYQDYGNSKKATVMRFDGGTWVDVGNPGFSAGAGSVTLAFSPDGVPYVGVNNGLDSDSSRNSVMKFDGSSWTLVGAAGFTDLTDSTEPIALGFAPNGTPYFFYENSPDYQAKAMRFNGSAWEDAGTGNVADYAFEIAAKFSPDGTPYASFIECPDNCYVVVKRLVVSAPPGPSVTTGVATNLTSSGATLNGTVNDNGSATTISFDYGTTSVYGTNVAATTPSGGSIAAGTGTTAASVDVSSLTPNTTYHFRVNATANGTTVNGSDATFTTSKLTPVITTPPTASAITYGQTLADSKFSGGAVSANGTAITGTFLWNDSTTQPTAGLHSYEVTFTPDDTAAYDTVTDTVSVTVNKATPTLTWGPLTAITYGTKISPTQRSATATFNGLPVGGTFAYSVELGDVLTAGSHTLNVTFSPDDAAATNFNSVPGSVTLVVNQATATVTLGNLTATYDGSTHAATATTDPSGLKVDLTYNGSPTAPTNAGSYPVVGTVNDTNYKGTTSGTLVIGQATATVTLSGLSATYDGNTHAATATTSPAGLKVDFTYNGSSTVPKDAGIYTVIGTIDDTNYKGSATNILNIKKAPATMVLGSLNQTYDGSAHAATATTVPSGLKVNFTYDGSATAPTNAGSYFVTGTVDDPNYEGTGIDTLKIDKATATVTLSGLSATYDGNPHAATATTTPNSLKVTFTYNGSSTAPINADSYMVVGTIDDANYKGSATNTLTIRKATATVALSNLSATYDGNPHAATATTTPGGLKVNLTYDGSATAPTNAGSHSVTGTVDDPNYEGTGIGTLKIDKALATVALGNLSATYDGNLHAATATTTPSGLTVTFTYNGSSTVPKDAGIYTVIGTIDDTNYKGSATNILNIKKAPATVVLGNLSPNYDGSAHAATAITVPSGLKVNFTYDGSTTAPTNAGSYSVTGTVDDPNYEGTGIDTLKIGKAAATVTLSGLNATYNGSAHAATVTTSPAGLPVDLTYNGSPTVPTNAGRYTVVGTINDANYQGTTSGTLKIDKAGATVTLSGLSATYDGSSHPATATTIPAGLTVNLTYNGSATAPANAGNYSVAATINEPNYQGSASDTLAIAKADATVTLSGLSATYDGGVHAAAATTVPAGLTVELTYDGSATAPIHASSYTVAGTINDPNYKGSTTGMLNIGKATPAVVTWPTASSIIYGTPLSNSTFSGGATRANNADVPGLFTWTNPATVPEVGTHSYPVLFTATDAADYNTVTGVVAVSTTHVSTSTVLQSSAGQVMLMSPLMFTATVSTSSGVPTGTVSFMEGTTPLGSATITNGVASLTVSTLTAGAHTITAVYSGDSTYAGSSSGTVSETVIDLNANQTVTGGSSNDGKSDVTALPGSTVNATLDFVTTLSVTKLPVPAILTVTGLPDGATVGVNPAVWAPTSGTSWTLPAATTLVNPNVAITLPSPTAKNSPQSIVPGWQKTASASVFLSLLLLPFSGQMRKAGRRLRGSVMFTVLLLVGLAATLGLSGCGTSNGFFGQPQKTYNVTMTVTAGTVTRSSNLTLTVQ
jgi:hypothetical protein